MNKKFTGEKNKEFNLRHDWHSLIENDGSGSYKFTSNYSQDNFPQADTLVKYLNDFAQKFELNIKYNTRIKNIKCSRDLSNQKKSTFELKDETNSKYNCKYWLTKMFIFLI